jgi:hypothetical protein
MRIGGIAVTMTTSAAHRWNPSDAVTHYSTFAYAEDGNKFQNAQENTCRSPGSALA